MSGNAGTVIPAALSAESASGQIALVSVAGTAGSPVYNYDITVTNTGTGDIGTFWFSWVPGENFLPSAPLSESSPAGWGQPPLSNLPAVGGANDSTDGTSIQWVAQNNGVFLGPGETLGGFDFSSPDSLAVLSGSSPTHPGTPVETSFVYGGQPFSDGGFQFVVTSGSPTPTPTPTPTPSGTLPATLGGALPTTIVAGQKTKISQTLRYTNDTGAVLTGAATTQLFLNGSPTLDAGAISLPETLASKLKLKTGKQGSQKIRLKSVPASVPAGVYYFIAQVTTATGVKSVAATSQTINIQKPQVNFAGIFTRTQAVALASGKTTTTAVVTNTGNIPATGLLQLFVSASTDGTVASVVGPVASIAKKINVKPGKSVAIRVKSIAPATPNSYFLLAQVDPNNHFGTPNIAGETFISAATVSVLAK